MSGRFDHAGVTFQYPANWDLDLEVDGDAWTAVVQSPGTAFVIVSQRPDAASPAELADEALDALKEEYAELEADAVVETLVGQPAVGHDVDFLSLDLPVRVETRAVETLRGPLLMLCQVSEIDAAVAGPVFAALRASLAIREELE